MDSQATAIVPEQLHGETGHTKAHPSYMKHQFESVGQQHETASFGMWVFLLTEVMFFGGMFCAYLVFRNWYHAAFVAGSNTLDIVLGTLNTALLICSSCTMAMGVHSAEVRKKKQLIVYLLATLILGLGFLVIKGVEWDAKFVAHHVPGPNFSIEEFVHPANPKAITLAPDMAEKTQIYFSLYFLLTGMHALHMIIGCVIIVFLIFGASRGVYTGGHVVPIENFGLYWHFVDIIWIFLFPLLYLISRYR